MIGKYLDRTGLYGKKIVRRFARTGYYQCHTDGSIW